jgi:hypothetical protein
MSLACQLAAALSVATGSKIETDLLQQLQLPMLTLCAVDRLAAQQHHLPVLT